MATTTLPDFLDALKAALDVRSGLSGVNVFTGPVLPEQLGAEAIELAPETDIEMSRAAMSSTDLEEAYEVSGSIIVYSPNPTIATAIADARDRCAAILEEVVDELASNTTMTATVRDVYLARQKWQQAPAPEGQLGRICRVEFGLAVEAHVTP